MTRHRLDLFSLLSGLVLVGLALAALVGVSVDVAVWVWPSILIVLGVVVLTSVLGSARTDAATTTADELPPHHVDDDPDHEAAIAAARQEVEDADRTTES